MNICLSLYTLLYLRIRRVIFKYALVATCSNILPAETGGKIFVRRE